MNCVTLRAEPSISESLVRTLPVTALSSATEAVSLRTTGASLTAVTVRARVDVENLLPSVIVTLTAGTVPFQLVAGVNV